MRRKGGGARSAGCVVRRGAWCSEGVGTGGGGKGEGSTCTGKKRRSAQLWRFDLVNFFVSFRAFRHLLCVLVVYCCVGIGGNL